MGGEIAHARMLIFQSIVINYEIQASEGQDLPQVFVGERSTFREIFCNLQHKPGGVRTWQTKSITLQACLKVVCFIFIKCTRAF